MATLNYRIIRRICAVISVALGFAAVSGFGLLASIDGQALAQGQPTPLQIFIPTRTETPVLEPTVTPTRTPTVSRSLIRVQARIEANIRTAPDLNAQVLRKVTPGVFFAVVGRRGKWLQIQFSESPTGLAWVFEEVVEITGGDPSTIPEVDIAAVPSPNVATGAAQETASFITSTPGAPGTATALQAAATGVRTLVAISNQNPGAPLPTFTYPPPFIEATLPARATAVASPGGVPPIVPIVGLGAVGLMGLFISALRRGR